jgi:hypothetical protein
MRFTEIRERAVDPVDLAIRTGRRYGDQKTDYGYSTSGTVKGKYIPLKNYDDDAIDEMELKLNTIYKSLGFYDLTTDQRKMLRTNLDTESSSQHEVDINKLHATQPFVRIEDLETLKNKIGRAKTILVIKFAGKLFIRDGHHAVLAARLRGETTIQAEVMDLDYLQDKYL